MTQDSRPLSPHLQIYRWQITMTLSILHRASGLMLSLGSVFFVYWLLALSSGEVAFAHVQAQLASAPGQVLLVAWSAALFFHLSNGIRHLFWDVGLGFEMPTVRRSGWAVIFATLVLTVLTWWLAAGVRA